MKDILSSRGIIEEDTCPLCKRMPETIGHLLKDCIYARDFWYKMNAPPLVIPSLQAIDDVNDWLQVNCLSKAMHQSSILWRYVFPFATWELWKHRNKVAFENSPLNINLHRPCLSNTMEF